MFVYLGGMLIHIIHGDFGVISIWLKKRNSSKHTVCMRTSPHMIFFVRNCVF